MNTATMKNCPSCGTELIALSDKGREFGASDVQLQTMDRCSSTPPLRIYTTDPVPHEEGPPAYRPPMRNNSGWYCNHCGVHFVPNSADSPTSCALNEKISDKEDGSFEINDVDCESLVQQLTDDFHTFISKVRAHLSARDSHQQRYQVALCQRERALRMREDQLHERLVKFAEEQRARQAHADWLASFDQLTSSPTGYADPHELVPSSSDRALQSPGNVPVNVSAEPDRCTHLPSPRHERTPTPGYSPRQTPTIDNDTKRRPTRSASSTEGFIPQRQINGRATEDRRHTLSSWPEYANRAPRDDRINEPLNSDTVRQYSNPIQQQVQQQQQQQQQQQTRTIPSRLPAKPARVPNRGRSKSSPGDYRPVTAVRDFGLNDIAEKQEQISRYENHSPYQQSNKDTGLRPPSKPGRTGSLKSFSSNPPISSNKTSKSSVVSSRLSSTQYQNQMKLSGYRSAANSTRIRAPSSYNSNANPPVNNVRQLRSPARYGNTADINAKNELRSNETSRQRQSTNNENTYFRESSPSMSLTNQSFSAEIIPYDDADRHHGKYDAEFVNNMLHRENAQKSSKNQFYDVAPTYKRLLRDLSESDVTKHTPRVRSRSLPAASSAESLPRVPSSRLRKKITNYKAYVKEVQNNKKAAEK